MESRVAQPAKPFEIRARHRAFAVHVGAQESCAKRFEARHHRLCLKRDALPPAVNRDVAPGRVESDDDLFSGDFVCQPPQESSIHFSSTESGASNNDLALAPPSYVFGAETG